jgi:hypothetical protein
MSLASASKQFFSCWDHCFREWDSVFVSWTDGFGAVITVSAAWLTVAGSLLPKSQFPSLRLPGSRLAQQILPAHKKIAFLWTVK